MIEEIYRMSQTEERTAEKVLMDDDIHYMHIVLPAGDVVQEHYTNAKSLYMTVLRGTLSIALGEQDFCEYTPATVIKIPFNTKMNIQNRHNETLELTIIKAPAPNK